MNNHRTEARASLRELSAAIIRLGVKTEDPELLFLGQASVGSPNPYGFYFSNELRNVVYKDLK